MSLNSNPLRVVILVVPGPDSGDVFGPMTILRYASQFVREQSGDHAGGYQIEAVSTDGKLLFEEGNGIQLTAERSFREVTGPIDTLMVMPIDENQLDYDNPELFRWLAEIAPRTRRVVGLCTGSYILARAGLLDGCRATIHWMVADDFSRQFPEISVDPDPIYIQDGNVYSSAGALAGLDLTLALVEEDFGAELARTVARFMVIFLKRPGSQSQFSAQLASQFAERGSIRELQGWIFDHLEENLSVDALAKRAGMSSRNFRRVFQNEVGITPAKFVERARLEAARRYLEESSEGTESIAAACGFGSGEQMRCTFMRTLGIPPVAYRERFSTSLSAARTGS